MPRMPQLREMTRAFFWQCTKLSFCYLAFVTQALAASPCLHILLLAKGGLIIFHLCILICATADVYVYHLRVITSVEAEVELFQSHLDT